MGIGVETAELVGKRFRCLPGCAYCCLCPPEVSGPELEYFQRAHPGTVEDLQGTPHIALQGGTGGCALLASRRCTDYGHRPFHCRAFPIRVHFSYRVQACANLSCRAIQMEDGPMLTDLLGEVLKESDGQLPPAAAAAEREWAMFVDKCRRGGAPVDLGAARLMAESLMDGWPAELGTDREEVIELISETFGAKELSELPVYIAPGLEWMVFRVERDMVRRYDLSESGALTPKGEWPIRAVPLLEMDSGGREAFASYMDLLNGRDNIAASAALVVQLTRFEDEFEEAYLDVLRDCALDLWWRASLLAFLNGAGVLGAAEIREGVVFCDADFLDMAGIGGML